MRRRVGGRPCNARNRLGKSPRSTTWPRQGPQSLQTDPVGDKSDPNLYAYVHEDPTDLKDPTGLESATTALDLTPGGFHYGTPEGNADLARLSRAMDFIVAADINLLAGDGLGALLGWGARGAAGAWVAVNEAMPATSAAFQLSQGGRAGMAFLVNGVKFDGVLGRTLMEAKAGYGQFVGKSGAFQSWFANSATGGRALVAQAERQLTAANGAKVVWKVDSQKAAGAIRTLFKESGVSGIDVQVAKGSCTGTRIC